VLIVHYNWGLKTMLNVIFWVLFSGSHISDVLFLPSQHFMCVCLGCKRTEKSQSSQTFFKFWFVHMNYKTVKYLSYIRVCPYWQSQGHSKVFTCVVMCIIIKYTTLKPTSFKQKYSVTSVLNRESPLGFSHSHLKNLHVL